MAGIVGRSGRKSDPDRTPKATGTPTKPAFDSVTAETFWDQYVPELVEMGVASHVDTPALVHLCELWACLRMAHMKCKDNPIDREARLAYTAYSAEFSKLSAKFGLNPKDRKDIKADRVSVSAIQPRKRS